MRNINKFTYAYDTTLIAVSEEIVNSLLMRMKEESEKAGLKFIIQKTKIMASNPITSWQIEGEEGDTVIDFIFLVISPKSLWIVTITRKLKDIYSLEEKPGQT